MLTRGVIAEKPLFQLKAYVKSAEISLYQIPDTAEVFNFSFD